MHVIDAFLLCPEVMAYQYELIIKWCIFVYNFFLKIKVYLCEDSAKTPLADKNVNIKQT